MILFADERPIPRPIQPKGPSKRAETTKIVHLGGRGGAGGGVQRQFPRCVAWGPELNGVGATLARLDEGPFAKEANLCNDIYDDLVLIPESLTNWRGHHSVSVPPVWSDLRGIWKCIMVKEGEIPW